MADKILSRLRNGHGLSHEEMRQVRLAAADLLESQERTINDLEDALENLHTYCRTQGIDTAAHFPGKPLGEVRTEMLNRVHALASFIYGYWTQCDVGPERTWGANLYDIIRTAPREAHE